MVQKWSVAIGFKDVVIILPCSFVAFLTSCVCCRFASGTLHLVESSFRAPSALKKLALVRQVAQGGFHLSVIFIWSWVREHIQSCHKQLKSSIVPGSPIVLRFWDVAAWRHLQETSVKWRVPAGILFACISGDQREGLGDLPLEPDVRCDKWCKGWNRFFKEWNLSSGTVKLAKGLLEMTRKVCSLVSNLAELLSPYLSFSEMLLYQLYTGGA